VNRDLDNLHDLLVLLREDGIVHYAYGALSVTLGPLPMPLHETEPTVKVDAGAKLDRPQSHYDHPSLWPGGKRPEFR
jgi:hypothetical protein